MMKSTNVYLLDSNQLENLTVSLSNQPFVDSFPSSGGYFAVSEQEDGTVVLEPVTNEINSWSPNQNYDSGDHVSWGGNVYKSLNPISAGTNFNETNWEQIPQDSVSQIFSLTDSTIVDYWEALDNIPVNSGSPSDENLSWKN